MQNKNEMDGASLRDPAGYVFHQDGQVWRCMYGMVAREWLAWFQTPEATELFDSGLLVRTTVKKVSEGGSYDFQLLLNHERVEWISYAQEWSFTMLRDAALLHLDLMERLLPFGMILKDANPSNVQWHEGRMCFIDVASVQPYKGGAWLAYGQFCQTMLFPLLSAAYGGMPLNTLLKGTGRLGITSALTSRLLGGRASFRSGVFVHVHLQRVLQSFIDRFGMADLSQEQVSAMSSQAVLNLVKSLRFALEKLPAPQQTAWTGYTRTSSYSEEQLERKRLLVETWLSMHIGRTDVVLDVGCNTGSYSRVAAAYARQVIAIDADMPCVDEIWRTAPSNILPLVVDIADQTPGGGWALSEQRPFLSRVQPDASLWLAVIHHLAIRNGIRLPEVCKEILKTSPLLIIEFVDPEDSMVQALLLERGIERLDYSRQKFLDLIKEAGAEIVKSESLSGTRQIYLIRSITAVKN